MSTTSGPSEVRDGVLTGPVRRPTTAARSQQGSIHDDATATKLGFRGGTVAGSIHMDQFPPLLIEAFGPRWFEQGSLSLYFTTATTDGEAVQAFAGQPPAGGADVQVDVWMERDDRMRVAEGTAAVGDSGEPTALQARDLRASEPSELRMFSDLRPGDSLGEVEIELPAKDLRARIEKGLLTEPLEWYTADSPWGGPIAAPSTAVGLLYRNASGQLHRHTGGAVGLFGAIEVRQVTGPLLLDRSYKVSGTILAAGQSPKTEYVWFETGADDTESGLRVAEMRMLLRFMKASSSLYGD
jgi:hypothetical protein